jgi:hypothetical protein
LRAGKQRRGSLTTRSHAVRAAIDLEALMA